MRRKTILVCFASGTLLLLLVVYALIGAMTGVYLCPALGFLDGSSCYLVRRGDVWKAINIKGASGPQVVSLSNRSVVDPGLLVTTVTLSDGTVIRAFAPLNLLDVWRLKAGEYHELGR